MKNIYVMRLLLILIPMAHRMLLLSSLFSAGSFPLEHLSFRICCFVFYHHGRLLAFGSAVTFFSSMHSTLQWLQLCPPIPPLYLLHCKFLQALMLLLTLVKMGWGTFGCYFVFWHLILSPWILVWFFCSFSTVYTLYQGCSVIVYTYFLS